MATPLACLGNISPYATPAQIQHLVSLIGPSSVLKLVADASATAEDPRFCFVQFINPKDNNVALHLTNTTFLDRALAVSLVNEIPAEFVEITAAARIAASGDAPSGHAPTAVPPSLVAATQARTSSPALVASPAVAPAAVGSPALAPTRVDSPGLAAAPAAAPPAILVPVAVLPVDAVQCEHAVVFFNKRVVYVTNLIPSASSDDVSKHFAKCGAIRGVRMMQNEDEKTFKYALVEFENEAGAANALTHSGIKFGGRTIRVQLSKSTIMNPKRLLQANEALFRLREEREKIEREKELERQKRERERELEREREREREKERERLRAQEREEREKEREREKEKERQREKERKSKKEHSKRSPDDDGDSASSAGSSETSDSDRGSRKKKRSDRRDRSRSRSPRHRSSHKSSRRD